MQSEQSAQFVAIPLTRGYAAVVDSSDADLADLYWHAETPVTGGVYATRSTGRVNGKRRAEKLHRVILSRILGRPLEQGEIVDHLDRDGLNCRRSNLRLASKVQNGANRKRHANNTSGLKGVTWMKANSKWMAQIMVNGRKIYLGLFTDPIEAHQAYVAAAKEHFGAFANDGAGA